MRVFISWSGDRSRQVAEALHGWLPNVLQSLEPWLSSADIQAGARWHQQLSAQLATTQFGILCLTPENQKSSWLLYEAGALSKSVEEARVVPYLIGLAKSQLSGPLGHFQAVDAAREGTFELLQSLNRALVAANERALSETNLARAYAVWWPQLEPLLERARGGSEDEDESPPTEAEASLLATLHRVASDFQAVLGRLEAAQGAEGPKRPGGQRG
ncbi:MAG TPA: toll/interleukin-1 receptor domain-containing protein [Thermoanaerobaculia bacterium]|nr:toll/interleukin-1 receptor domain-containing protein [Thermoanaerobaculia bacterium]